MNQESRANLLPEKDQNPDEGRHQTGVSKEIDNTNLDSSTNPTSMTGRAPMSSKTGIGSWSEREPVREQMVLHSSGETDENETLKLGDSQSPPLLLYEQSVPPIISEDCTKVADIYLCIYFLCCMYYHYGSILGQ